MTISNSIFDDIQVKTKSAVRIDSNSVSYLFENVTFEGIDYYYYSSNTLNNPVMISIGQQNVSVVFKNCVFRNNNNWASIIYCGSNSYCNVTLINCFFENNVGSIVTIARNNGTNTTETTKTTTKTIINGLWLETDANSQITIIDSLFIGATGIDMKNESLIFNNNDSIIETINCIFISSWWPTSAPTFSPTSTPSLSPTPSPTFGNDSNVVYIASVNLIDSQSNGYNFNPGSRMVIEATVLNITFENELKDTRLNTDANIIEWNIFQVPKDFDIKGNSNVSFNSNTPSDNDNIIKINDDRFDANFETNIDLFTFNEQIYNSQSDTYDIRSAFILYNSKKISQYSYSICNAYDDTYFKSGYKYIFEFRYSNSEIELNITRTLILIPNEPPNNGTCHIGIANNNSTHTDAINLNISCVNWNDVNQNHQRFTINYFYDQILYLGKLDKNEEDNFFLLENWIGFMEGNYSNHVITAAILDDLLLATCVNLTILDEISTIDGDGFIDSDDYNITFNYTDNYSYSYNSPLDDVTIYNVSEWFDSQYFELLSLYENITLLDVTWIGSMIYDLNQYYVLKNNLTNEMIYQSGLINFQQNLLNETMYYINNLSYYLEQPSALASLSLLTRVTQPIINGSYEKLIISDLLTLLNTTLIDSITSGIALNPLDTTSFTNLYGKCVFVFCFLFCVLVCWSVRAVHCFYWLGICYVTCLLFVVGVFFVLL